MSVAKSHCLAPQGRKGFRVSKYLQQKACYLGQQLSFDSASETLLKIGGISLTDKQIERVVHHYGEELEEELYRDSVESKDATLTYAMMDGCMCLTREEAYKEVKVGRIFSADALLSEKKRGTITESDYVAHLGNHDDFLDKFERRISHKTNLVAIADGASWIWNFWDENYPAATQILDYFHVIEKIGNWAKMAIKDPINARNFIALQEEHLLDDKAEEVIIHIESVDCKAFTKEKAALLTYLKNHKHRMYYKTYQNKGLLIGSGPIESANRQLIQERLKKSGQRWTKKGLQQVANLRVAYYSDRWNLVENAIKKAA